MPRLIDADALKTKKVYSEERHEKVVPVAEIDWMPTVDAVQVVRCGECAFCNEINCPQYYRRTELTDDYFCADGERISE